MAGADGMSSKFMKSAFVGWTMTAGLYYPPDFDQSKLLPMKMLRPKGVDPNVRNMRMMFPFTMVCDSCNEYNYTGTKFTAKVEEIKTEMYLGLRVYRFYGRCRHCWAEFTFKTDPKNSDYTMESGGKRTYEAWKDADMMEAQLAKEKEEDKNDQMKALEQKAIDVQAELQRTEDLDAIRTMNKRLGHRELTIQEALDHIFKREEELEASSKALAPGEVAEMASFREDKEELQRKRLDDQLDKADKPSDELTELGGESAKEMTGAGRTANGSSARDAVLAAAVAERTANASSKSQVAARFSVKRKEAPSGAQSSAETEAPAKKACESGGIGLGSYDSDSS